MPPEERLPCRRCGLKSAAKVARPGAPVQHAWQRAAHALHGGPQAASSSATDLRPPPTRLPRCSIAAALGQHQPAMHTFSQADIMVGTRAQTAPRPLALLDALLSDNPSMAHRLLAGSGAAQLTHTGPGGLTTLHAALLCRQVDLLPSLVAAGAPLDTLIECHAWEQPLKALLVHHQRRAMLVRGATPLAYAVR